MKAAASGHENVVKQLFKLGGNAVNADLKNMVSECIDGCVCVFSIQ